MSGHNQPIEHSKRKHAFAGASTSPRYMKCSGSLYVGYGLRSPSKPWTREGSRGHELSDRVLKDWITRPDLLSDDAYWENLKLEYVDTEAPDQWHPGVQRTNMVVYVKQYLRIVQQEISCLFAGQPNIRVEKQLDLFADLNMYGTLDFFATGKCRDDYADRPELQGKDVGLVIDFKYGVGVQVKADDNWQLIYYAGMLLKNSKLELQAIRNVIYQPRAEVKHTAVWLTSEELTLKLHQLRQGAIKAIYQAAVREPELHAGEHCRFCPAKNTCPEYQELSLPGKSASAPEATNEIPAECDCGALADLE